MTVLRRFALAATLALAALGARAQEPVKIGFISTFSGPNAAIGQDMRDAAELALDHVGRRFGNRPVTMIYEDDEQKPEAARQKVDRLLRADRADFIAGVIWSNVLLAISRPVFEAQRFLIVTNAGASPFAGAQCSPFLFSTSWNNDQTPMAMGEVLNRRNVQRLYLMTPNYAAGRDMAAGLKRTYRGSIAGEEFTRWPDQMDFAAEIARIRSVAPDAVWMFYPGAHGAQFLAQFAQAGLLGKIPVYNSFTVDAINLPLQKELALGVLGTQQWVWDLPNEANRRFVAEFRQRHGRYPSYYAAQTYDGIRLIDSAVRKVNGDLADKDRVRAALRAADFASVRGPFRFNRNHMPVQDFYLQETMRDADGAFTVRTVEKVFTAHQDPHVGDCPMTW
jgi:branched-chain amino acid transport system substrate-binding protein